MLELSDIKPGEKVADLGSGDGRIVIEFAKKGAEAHGYELDSELVFKSNNLIKQEGLEHIAFIHNADFWREDLSSFDVITIYPMPDIMEDLENKLVKELKTNTRILLNYYPFPHLKPNSSKHHIYLYKI